MDNGNLYREEILDHYQNPRNFRSIKNADSHVHQANPLCGDNIEMFVKWGKGAKRDIQDISFQGKGCAICLAGASMLTEYAKGKSEKELTKFSETDMLKLLGIEVSETRKKCALLSFAVLRECL
jgi:nitrogen fixation NifU-like protein